MKHGIWMGRGVGAVAAVAAVVAATAAGATAPAVKTSHNATFGSILVTTSGKTLYRYTVEGKGMVKCNGTCAAAWPPLLATGKGKPAAGTGLEAAKLGTVKRSDGKLQVTYGGYPLYLFKGDTKAGVANGQGDDNVWYVVAPSGAVVKKTAAAAAPANTTPTSTPVDTGTPSSGGSAYGG